MTPHHGEPSEELKSLFQNQQESLKRLEDQLHDRAQRKWSDGRLSGDDEGDIAFAITGDKEKGVVIVDFGKSVDWIGLPPQQAIELAQALIKHARAIATEPVVVRIN